MPEGNFKCNICDKSFKYKIVRDFHLDVSHNITYYQCSKCDENNFENFHHESLIELYDHLYSFHGENNYEVLFLVNIF